jgi:proline racemase
VDVPFIGWIAVDVVYSGMWYCVVDLSTFTQPTLKKVYEINQMSNVTTVPDPCPPIEITPSNGKLLCRVGEMIKVACREQYPVNHEQIDYPGCDILVFMENAEQAVHRKCSKNTVVMSNGALDWSRPETWTGSFLFSLPHNHNHTPRNA